MELSQAAKLARLLMNGHGLLDWTFGFDRAKRRCGCCRKRRKLITLSMSYVSLNGIEEVTDTILHEIAHALCPVGGHGPAWKAICRQIGAVPRSCAASNVIMPPKPYVAVCGGCGVVIRRHRRQRNLYCAKCGPEQGRLSFRREGQ